MLSQKNSSVDLPKPTLSIDFLELDTQSQGLEKSSLPVDFRRLQKSQSDLKKLTLPTNFKISLHNGRNFAEGYQPGARLVYEFAPRLTIDTALSPRGTASILNWRGEGLDDYIRRVWPEAKEKVEELRFFRNRALEDRVIHYLGEKLRYHLNKDVGNDVEIGIAEIPYCPLYAGEFGVVVSASEEALQPRFQGGRVLGGAVDKSLLEADCSTSGGVLAPAGVKLFRFDNIPVYVVAKESFRTFFQPVGVHNSVNGFQLFRLSSRFQGS